MIGRAGAGQAADVPPDSIRAALEEVFAREEFDWTRIPDPLAFLRDWFGDLSRWSVQLQSTHPFVFWLLVLTLAAVLVSLLVHIGYVIWRAVRPVGSVGGAAPGPRRSPQRDARWHLGETDRLRGEGRYVEALAHRFAALLLDLDRRGAVRFHPSKTPAEYRLELRAHPGAAAGFAELVGRLYGHLFGGEVCGVDDVDEFDRAATELGGRFATS